MANVEGLILHQGLLSQEDIEEIHRVFVMMDSDGTGALTLPELRAMTVQITKDPNITMEEARQLHAMLDVNCDGMVTWEEFLQFVCKWLHERGGARVKMRTDLPSSFNEKDTLHKCIAQLFSLDKVSFDTSQLPSDHVDNRAETWDYLGEAVKYSDTDKNAYFTTVFQTLSTPGNLQKIVDEVNGRDFALVLGGLKSLSHLLGIMNVFQTARDRSKISLFLTQLFELVIHANILPRVISALSLDNNEIQWEALKVLTYFAPGPRVPGLPQTHVLHPSQRTTKTIVINAGAGPHILRLCDSPCLEVRDQALLCIGFIARHDGEARDYIVSLGTPQLLVRQLSRPPEALRVDLSSVIRAAWVLSIVCGATIPKEAANPKFNSQQLLEIGATLAKLFVLQDQDNLIANSLTALAYILPYLSPDQNCKVLLDRVVYLIQYPNVTVKRAALQTVRNLVWGSAAHSQLLTEVGLYTRLNEILSHPADVVVKLDAFTVLRSLIQKGYTYEMMNLSLFTQQLQLTIASDPDLRWEAVRLAKVIAFSNFRIAIEDMIRQGMTRTLFQYMICFKEVSPVFASAYGVNCYTYNFSFLNDCAVVLEKFVVMGWTTGDPMMSNTFTKYFDREEATFLFEVIKVLTTEVRKGNQDLYNLNHGEVNLEKSLCSLVENVIRMHSGTGGGNSRFLVEYLSNILSEGYADFFRSTLRQTNFSMLANSQITPDRILNCVRTYTVKCFDLTNYPNGDNRLLQNIRREDLTFYNLKRLVRGYTDKSTVRVREKPTVYRPKGRQTDDTERGRTERGRFCQCAKRV